jgi:4-hydroxy-tetrahydrodipicolinate synthase
VEFLLSSGVQALCALMHVGESLNLSFAERELLASLTVRASGGRVPVVVHVSCPGTDHTVRLARHAQSVGADAVIVTSPYHWHPGEEGMSRHFDAVADAVGIPFLGYSPPPSAGTPLTPELVTRLARRHEHFLGLKEASNHMGTFGEFARAAEAVRPDFSVLGGIEYTLPQRALGGAGSFSVCALVAPRLVTGLWKAVSEDDHERARELQARMTRLLSLLVPRYPAGVKAAAGLMGRPVGGPRLPVPPLTPAENDRLAAALDEAGVTATEPYGWEPYGSEAPGREAAAVATAPVGKGDSDDGHGT